MLKARRSNRHGNRFQACISILRAAGNKPRSRKVPSNRSDRSHGGQSRLDCRQTVSNLGIQLCPADICSCCALLDATADQRFLGGNIGVCLDRGILHYSSTRIVRSCYVSSVCARPHFYTAQRWTIPSWLIPASSPAIALRTTAKDSIRI